MLTFIFLTITIFVSPFAQSCAEPANNYIVSLNSNNTDGLEWTVQNANGSIKTTATVPGGIYSDLMNAGIIDDVYFKDNDIKTRWVSKVVWMYKMLFNVSSEILEKEIVDIVFDGLDTIAYISVNDHPVALTDNMFVRYKYDIKKYLKEGENELSVQFDSPVLAAAALSEKHMVPPECVPDVYKGECHANQLRKMQASFSWDWGPALPSSGIWKPVNLEAYNSAVIRDVTVNTTYSESDSVWDVSFKIYLDVSKGVGELEGHLFVAIYLDNDVVIREYKFIQENVLKRTSIEQEINLQLFETYVKRWWPNGYGEQNLYKVQISFQSTKFVDEYFYKDIKIGFRTLELIQDPLDDGLTYYFKVNGHAIFMKGSNWIPGNILPEKGYENVMVDNLLYSAKLTHMNMLRVWGGGVYESDYFYQKCDELGLLVWQDMMFACSMYPANSKFLSSVSEEVEQVVKRLQHHPSIALWAGNNENEAALRDNWYGTAGNFNLYKDEYISLYVDTIRPVVQKIDPTRTYVISSPNNGLQSEKEGFIAQNPSDPRYGDTHYYNYIQNLWSMDTYPKSRFCSEYGFQSIPSFETLLKATDDLDDLHIDSEFMKHREHNDFNNYESMAMQIIMQFGPLDHSDPNYSKFFQYYSQVIQAWAMKTETEFYRQSREDWMTMGALYWQLNDVWQAPTWSGIEFGGRWKMLHFYVKDFFSPILISPRLLPTNDITVHVINDNIQEILNATMIIETFNWNSLTPINSQSRQVNLRPLTAEKFDSNIVLPSAALRKSIYYRFSLKNEEHELLSPYNYIFPVPLKDIEGYSVPNITLTINNVSGDSPVYEVDVKTDGVGLFVWLEIEQGVGWFSENGFILTENTKRIQLYTESKKSISNLKSLRLKTYNQANFVKNMEIKNVR